LLLVELDPAEEYERGKREGRVDALLEEHTVRLNKINGSVERAAIASEKLIEQVRRLGDEATLREERTKAAAEALAAVTEQKRAALEVENLANQNHDRPFTKRIAMWTLFASFSSALVTASGVYLATHG
jgi:predicted  nucleic acid-binding Zn-ribbon protein